MKKTLMLLIIIVGTCSNNVFAQAVEDVAEIKTVTSKEEQINKIKIIMEKTNLEAVNVQYLTEVVKHLELQMQQLEMAQKIRGLTKNLPEEINGGSFQQSENIPTMELTFLAYSENYKEAYIEIEGEAYIVREGDRPTSRLIVEEIAPEYVAIRVNKKHLIKLTMKNWN